ncbi:MAG: dolichyl-phosphate mannose synthase [Methanobacteriales archaeon Met13]
MNITAVIPAYNEENTIGSVVLGTRQYILRVIVVDDGSSDRTAEIAKLAGAQILVHPINQGKGRALQTGFEATPDADIIVTLDSDGQHQPREIPKIIKPLLNDEADVVIGSRYISGNDRETPTYRRVGQTVLDKATNISGGMKITDSQSGFRAFTSQTFKIFSFHHSDYSIESEMLIEASRAGFRIKEVDITTTYGEKHHHKKNPVSHGISVLVRLLQDMEFNRPLYYFGLPGLILVLIGLIYGLFSFGEYLGGVTRSLAPTIMAALIALIGTFMAFTGLILHSISRMIMRTMRK